MEIAYIDRILHGYAMNKETEIEYSKVYIRVFRFSFSQLHVQLEMNRVTFATSKLQSVLDAAAQMLQVHMMLALLAAPLHARGARTCAPPRYMRVTHCYARVTHGHATRAHALKRVTRRLRVMRVSAQAAMATAQGMRVAPFTPGRISIRGTWMWTIMELEDFCAAHVLRRVELSIVDATCVTFTFDACHKHEDSAFNAPCSARGVSRAM